MPQEGEGYVPQEEEGLEHHKKRRITGKGGATVPLSFHIVNNHGRRGSE